MAKFTWQDGTLVSKAKVEINGTIYEVDPEEYSGATPLSASNLNAMQDGIYDDINPLEEDINLLKPTTLYLNETAPVSTGTITLTDDISNYSKVDITFVNNDSEVCGVTIYNPANKKICLQSSHAGSTNYFLTYKFSYITLNGTTGTYESGRDLVITSNKSIFSVSSSNLQKVTSIIGYK